MSNMRIAVLFAGQGAQYPGMGKDIYDTYPNIQTLYQQASTILGYNIGEVCFVENSLMHQTRYTQPAIFVTSSALYQALINQIPIKPKALAGFSLGEYTALYASGALSFHQALEIVGFRAHVMDQASLESPGEMYAILGLDTKIVEEIAESIPDIYVVNYNCPMQVVVSGKQEAAIELISKAKDKGARRAIRLAVSGAFHSPFMMPAANRLYDFIKPMEFNEPNVPIIMNRTANPLSFESLKNLIFEHTFSPVLFEQSIRYIIDVEQINLFIEIGPGKVLSGFVQKINPAIPVVTINTQQDIETFSKEIQL